MLTRKQRSLITKIRLGVFPINLELGRYNSIPRNERYCPVCNSKEVENEFHILFNCEIYSKERNILLNHANRIYPNFMDLHNMQKFIMLISNFSLLRKSANYLNDVLTIKQCTLRK